MGSVGLGLLLCATLNLGYALVYDVCVCWMSCLGVLVVLCRELLLLQFGGAGLCVEVGLGVVLNFA